MADKISDQQVADLIALLRSEASLESKVNQVTAIKSGIKQHNVPDTCIVPLFEALRTASTSQHANLVNAGFTALNHLLTRLSRQDPKFVTKEAPRTLAVLVEKLGDQKDKFRTLASQALTTIYLIAPVDVERVVRNQALAGKSSRAKEAGMQWLLQTHQEHGLPFRGYVPILMELLEDADPMVRDAAKTTVIELFRNGPNAAKSDLKRQLKNFKVRPAIEQAIVKELAPTATGRPETPADHPSRPPSRLNLAASVSSLGTDRPITPMPEARAEQVEPLYVNTQRELEDIFRTMHEYAEGRETEQNWMKREESMTNLRRLMVGNAATDFADFFLTSLRSLLDGIIKAVVSLRTSLSKEGCAVVQDMATTFGAGIDPMVELLLQALVKLSGGTKKISSQLANTTVAIVISKATYSNRLMQHIWGACQDKNVPPRLYAADWLKTLLVKEAHHKSHVEHSGGVDIVEKCIKKGLSDPNPGVREKMRGTYWAFAGIWPARAEVIMDGLDATAQKLLNKDPNNPSSPKKGAPARPGLGLSKSTMGSSKPSLKETMLAQKKAAMAARNLPARPGSAMSHFSPVRVPSGTAAAKPSSNNASSSQPATTRTRGEPTLAVNSGGMSVAPMRPIKKRPELAARPATAGPYTVRGHDRPGMESNSPQEPKKPAKPAVAATPRPGTTVSPRRLGQRVRPGHAPHASDSSIPSPTHATLTKQPSGASTRASPVALRQPRMAPASSSPASAANEEMTMVVPTLGPRESPSRGSPPTREQPSPVQETTTSAEPAAPEELPQATPDAPPTPGTPLALATSIALPDDSPGLLGTPAKSLEVYEDPFVEDHATPKAAAGTRLSPGPVLGDKAVNEMNGALVPVVGLDGGNIDANLSPEKTRQNARLLDSGITRVRAKSLDVHGLRKLQSLIRDSKSLFTDDKFSALLLGLFQYLEDPLENTEAGRAQDIKAQVLSTIKLLLKKERDNFQPHISRGLEALLTTRRMYDARSRIVSGLELLADELAALGDVSELVMTMTKMLQASEDSAAEGARTLSMGLHVLKELLEARGSYSPGDADLKQLVALAGRCLESSDSGVRMDAVHLCVAMHTRAGDGRFWESMSSVREDPKSLITYYIVKKQREVAA